jgi:membrane associated rhomboid family serine protease
MGIQARGVDNAAHLGGFLTGVAMGAVIHLFDRRASEPQSEQIG